MYCTCVHVGTKNVAKELKKICQGANKWEGVNWWRELADKRTSYKQKYTCTCMCMQNHLIGKSTKVHLYWAMKNCDGSPEDLRHKIMNTSKHYQVCVHVLYTNGMYMYMYMYNYTLVYTYSLCNV